MRSFNAGLCVSLWKYCSDCVLVWECIVVIVLVYCSDCVLVCECIVVTVC